MADAFSCAKHVCTPLVELKTLLQGPNLQNFVN